MSQTAQISSHTLTPRWVHAIDVRAESRRDDSVTFMAIGLSLLAALRDQPVPLAPVPHADLPRRAPLRREPPMPPRAQTPLSVPQEIESIPEQHARAVSIDAAYRADC